MNGDKTSARGWRTALTACLGSAIAFAGTPARAEADAGPHMERQEILQLFTAGGFTFANNRLTNRCGEPANPHIGFVDLNGDGQPEAHLMDVSGACYKGRAYFAILRRAADGRWVPILTQDGVAGVGRKRTKGWLDIDVVRGPCPGPRHFNGQLYVGVCDNGAGLVASDDRVPASPPPANAAPSSVAKRDDAAPEKASAAPVSDAKGAVKPHYPQAVDGFDEKPTPQIRAFVKKALGSEWPDIESVEGHRVDFGVGHADLNDDGRPDLLIHYTESSDCGSLGCAGAAFLATSDGYAPRPIDLPHFYQRVVVLPKTHKGMHDLRFDDAHYIFRWKGSQYN